MRHLLAFLFALVLCGTPGAVAQQNLARFDDAYFASATYTPAYTIDFVNSVYRINGTAYSSITQMPGYIFTRSSVGYKLNAAGGLDKFNANVPRINSLGFLSEEVATNVLLQNRTLTVSPWAVTGTVTVTQNQTGIDGTANGAALIAGGASGGTVCQTGTLSGAFIYTHYIKLVSGSGVVELALDGTNYTTDQQLIPGGIPTATFARLPINADTSVGLTETLSGSSQVCIKIGASTNVVADMGQVESATAFGFPTSPIVTTTVAATRSQDKLQIGADAVPLAQGTAVASATFTRSIDGNTRGIVGTGSGGRLISETATTGQVQMRNSTGSTSGIGVVPINTPFVVAQAWGTQMEGSLDGAPTVITANANPITIASDALSIGNYGGGTVWTGNIQSVFIYSQQFSTSQLRAAAAIAITPGIDQVQLAHAYGSQVFVPGYSGPAYNVTATGGPNIGLSRDIGYLGTTVGSMLDNATADSFAGGFPLQFNGTYDQIGGCNGTAVSNDQFYLSADALIGNSRPAVFPIKNLNNPFSPNEYGHFQFGSCMALASQNFSVVWIGAMGHSERDVPIWEQSTGTTPGDFGQINQLNALGAKFLAGGPRSIPGYADPITPQVTGFTSGSGGTTVYGALNASSTGPTVTALTASGGLNGGTTFLAVGSALSPGYGLQAGLLLYNKTQSYLQYQATALALYSNFAVATNLPCDYFWDGDSITEGINILYLESAPRQDAPLLNTQCNIFNVAIGGGTTQTQIAHFPQWIGPINPLRHQVSFWRGGSNNLGSETGAQTWADTIVYLQQARAIGHTEPFILEDIIDRCDISETERANYNALAAANYASAGFAGFIDLASDSQMGVAGTCSNTTLFQPGGTHPTQAGDAHIASLESTWINANNP